MIELLHCVHTRASVCPISRSHLEEGIADHVLKRGRLHGRSAAPTDTTLKSPFHAYFK